MYNHRIFDGLVKRSTINSKQNINRFGNGDLNMSYWFVPVCGGGLDMMPVCESSSAESCALM